MNSLPTELVTLLGSSLLGGIMRIWGISLQTKRLNHLLGIHSLKTRAVIINDARRFSNHGFQWTRRIIALTATFFIIVFPKLIAALAPSIPIHIAYTETSSFLFWANDFSKVNWIHLSGIVITPLDTHLLSAIIGLYFGGALIGNNH